MPLSLQVLVSFSYAFWISWPESYRMTGRLFRGNDGDGDCWHDRRIDPSLQGK
jgi:hypothetical protein